jgi:hypothetical protein
VTQTKAGAHQHLIGAQAAVTVQVYALKKVVEADVVALVFLAQDEVHKVLVAHLAFLPARKYPWCLHADPPGSMAAKTRKVDEKHQKPQKGE